MKKIFFHEEARNKLKAGADVVANAVKVTLGPSGRHVVISDFHGSEPIATKDGVTVAEYIIPEDRTEAVGAELIKNVARKTVRDAGDGTTTATVLAQSMITNGMHIKKSLQQKFLKALFNIDPIVNVQDVKRGMDKTTAQIVDNIKKASQKVNGNIEMIKNVASISANNDSEIGSLIADAFSKIGEHGIIEVEDSMTSETSIRIVEGIQVDRGWKSKNFVTDNGKMTAELENPFVIVTDYDISLVKELDNILGQIISKDPTKAICLVCSGLEGEALAFVTQNKLAGRLKVNVIIPPSAYRAEFLEDIAVLTGATVISDKIGVKLETAPLDYIGSCGKVISTESTTRFIDGNGKKDKISVLQSEVIVLLEGAKPHDKDRLTKRLASITNGIAIMSVGANSETEAGEKKDRIDDAIRATKAAIEEGIVVGGGSCLLSCIGNIDNSVFLNKDEMIGRDIILKAAEAPIRQILTNCGITSYDTIIDKIKSGEEIGYNAKTMTHENLFISGVIDPAKVVRVALENANSIAGMFITTECLNVDIAKTNPKF